MQCSGPSVVPPEFLHTIENKLYSYADDSNLVAVVPSSGEIVAVTYMNCDCSRVSKSCIL